MIGLVNILLSYSQGSITRLLVLVKMLTPECAINLTFVSESFFSSKFIILSNSFFAFSEKHSLIFLYFL